MPALPSAAAPKSVEEGVKSWNERGFRLNGTPVERGEVTSRTLLQVQGYGELELELQQPGGATAVKHENVAHVPVLTRNRSSSTRTRQSWD